MGNYRAMPTNVPNPSYNWTGAKMVTTTYTILATDDFVVVTLASAPCTVTLPSIATLFAQGFGAKSYKIKTTNGATYALTVAPATGDTIDGTTSFVMDEANDYIVIQAGLNNDWAIEDTNAVIALLE